LNAHLDTKLLETITRAVEVLTAFTVPLYVDVDRRPMLRGSGFFVRQGSVHFLVSAAHVFDGVAPGQVYFYSTPAVLRHVTGYLLRSGKEKPRDEDLVDIAVVRLEGDPQPPFPAVAKAAVDIGALRAGQLPRTGKNYAIIGYPETKNRPDVLSKTIEAKPYAYRAFTAPEADYAACGRALDTHLLMPLNLRKGFAPDGTPVHFPKPQGMSGSPISVLYDDDLSDRSASFPVVAVGTRYIKSKKLLVATDAGYVLEAIARAA
jgi:hypothetical protein